MARMPGASAAARKPRSPDDGAEQLGHVGLALDVIGVLHEFARPALEGDRVGGDDSAHRQSALRHEDLWPRVLRLHGLGLRRGAACEHRPCGERGECRDEQRRREQQHFLPIHG